DKTAQTGERDHPAEGEIYPHGRNGQRRTRAGRHPKGPQVADEIEYDVDSRQDYTQAGQPLDDERPADDLPNGRCADECREAEGQGVVEPPDPPHEVLVP